MSYGLGNLILQNLISLQNLICAAACPAMGEYTPQTLGGIDCMQQITYHVPNKKSLRRRIPQCNGGFPRFGAQEKRLWEREMNFCD